MSDLVVAPEGVELAMKVYVVSYGGGLNACITVSGLPGIGPFKENISVKELVGDLPSDSDWRLMTRAEVAAFKADEDDS